MSTPIDSIEEIVTNTETLVTPKVLIVTALATAGAIVAIKIIKARRKNKELEAPILADDTVA